MMEDQDAAATRASLHVPSGHAPTEAEKQTLLRACFADYRSRLLETVGGALEQTGDLFESAQAIPDGKDAEFRAKRGEWQERFGKAVDSLFERRLAGQARKGRRPDFDASIATLRVLTAFDQEKQAALAASTAFLMRFTRREISALDLRIRELLPETAAREIDNPFSPPYLVDALGLASRQTYPDPRVWRPLMKRLLSDITAPVNKVYISLNRLLADRGVLSEIKAALRARSEFRPADDRDLLPAFSRMLAEAGGDDVLPNVVVPDALGDPAAPAPFDFHRAGGASASATPAAAAAGIAPASASWTGSGAAGTAGSPLQMPTPDILAGLTALARLVGNPAEAPRHPGGAASASAFPDLDPLMALGASTPLFSTLARLQRLDLPAALAGAAATAHAANAADAGPGTGVVPLNLIPHIRTAIADQIATPTDRVAMDVIALLFDYIFRDPSIPDEMRRLFGRLQVPVVKAALLDRAFFSDREHPARLLLDHLAEAAIGATGDGDYAQQLGYVAAGVVDDVCSDFEIDLAVFAKADRKLAAFVDEERRRDSPALEAGVAQALATENAEADRAGVRALVRDRLAGLDLPFEVRAFVETTWADYLTALRKAGGEDSDAWRAAWKSLDDLLWSILDKERTAQKARLTRMIPSLVMGLRKGCAAQQVPADRAKSFFDTLYQLHTAAIRPRAQPAATAAPASDATAAGEGPAGEIPEVHDAAAPVVPRANVHDFVSEMAVGTWLAFGAGADAVPARLSWVSPLRSKYIFTSRVRAQAFLFTPEELAWELGAGTARLVVEPVPLFDRAVSAALDSVAAMRPSPDAAPKAA